MTPFVRETQPGDAEALAPVLREADLREIAASCGGEALMAVKRSVAASTVCHTIIDEQGEVAGIFGTAPLSPGLAIVWLLGSPALEAGRTARQFLRESKLWALRLQLHTPVLVNFVDARNTTTIRWLKWIGFEFRERPVPFGIEGRPFYMFQRKPKCVSPQPSW